MWHRRSFCSETLTYLRCAQRLLAHAAQSDATWEYCTEEYRMEHRERLLDWLSQNGKLNGELTDALRPSDPLALRRRHSRSMIGKVISLSWAIPYALARRARNFVAPGCFLPQSLIASAREALQAFDRTMLSPRVPDSSTIGESRLRLGAAYSDVSTAVRGAGCRDQGDLWPTDQFLPLSSFEGKELLGAIGEVQNATSSRTGGEAGSNRNGESLRTASQNLLDLTTRLEARPPNRWPWIDRRMTRGRNGEFWIRPIEISRLRRLADELFKHTATTSVQPIDPKGAVDELDYVHAWIRFHLGHVQGQPDRESIGSG